MDGNDQERIWSGASPEEVARDLAQLVEFRDEGVPLEELANLLQIRLAPHLMRYDRPSFQSMFNAFPEEGAALGARMALEFNQGVTNWQVSPGGAVLEEMCCEALCRLLGLAAGSEGTFLLSGTYANHQALYMALHRRAERCGFDLAQDGLAGFSDSSRLAVAASKDAHFSLRHTVRTLGLGERSLLNVPLDANRRLDVEGLRRFLEESGRDVFSVVATAGTTQAGAVDPVGPIAELCERAGTWLHVDGAYGLAYKLVPEWSRLFAGVERADSVSWDPHKQLGVPIPCSLLFARRPEDFDRMSLFSGYFNRRDARGPNPGLKSMPSTRPFAALALVASIRHQGVAGLKERLRAPLEAIRDVAEHLRSETDMELCHGPDTGVLCFRVAPRGFPPDQLDRLQSFVYGTLTREGRRSISVTELDGRTVLRLVAISPSVTAAAMKDTIAEVRRVARDFV